MTARVACFPLYPPVELVHAVGATPVVLWAPDASAGDTTIGDRHVQPFACGIAKRITGYLIGSGRGRHDAVLAMNACDTLRNLPEIATGTGDPPPFLHLHVPQQGLDRPHGEARLRHGINVLATRLGELLGTSLDTGDFIASVELYRRMRTVQKELQRFVAEGRLDFSSLAALVQAGHASDPAVHVMDLERYRDSAAANEATPARCPVVLSGITPPPPAFLQAMDDAGMRIVANDIASMHRSAARTPAPRLASDPGSYYVDFYLHHCPCTTLLHTADQRPGYLLDVARASRAKGIVFAGEKFCEHEFFEYPYLESMFKQAGMPVLCTEISSEGTDHGARDGQRLEAFAEMITGGRD